MLNIEELAEEIHELTAWQETPYPLDQYAYVKMVRRAIRRFFVDINHPEEYSKDLFVLAEDGYECYDRDFIADEEEYIKCLCKIEFYQRVQTDVNNRFGYSTNALTITNADKPYANLKDTLSNLEHERRILFHKMVRYTLGVS